MVHPLCLRPLATQTSGEYPVHTMPINGARHSPAADRQAVMEHGSPGKAQWQGSHVSGLALLLVPPQVSMACGAHTLRISKRKISQTIAIFKLSLDVRGVGATSRARSVSKHPCCLAQHVGGSTLCAGPCWFAAVCPIRRCRRSGERQRGQARRTRAIAREPRAVRVPRATRTVNRTVPYPSTALYVSGDGSTRRVLELCDVR